MRLRGVTADSARRRSVGELMSSLVSLGSENHDLSSAELQAGLLCGLRALGGRSRVLVVPPDFTRYHSRAGELTTASYQFYRQALVAVLPDVGNHVRLSRHARHTRGGQEQRRTSRELERGRALDPWLFGRALHYHLLPRRTDARRNYRRGL